MLTVGPAISQGLQAAVTSEKVLLLTTNYVPMTAEDRWKDYVCQDFAEPGALFQTSFTALRDQTGNVPSE